MALKLDAKVGGVPTSEAITYAIALINVAACEMTWPSC
jgi:hypothetical protein